MKRDQWFNHSASQDDLLHLIKELGAENSQPDRIQQLMKNLGIEYSSDPVVQMERVLCTLSGMDHQTLTGFISASEETKDASNI